jgi:hypothetical protein
VTSDDEPESVAALGRGWPSLGARDEANRHMEARIGCVLLNRMWEMGWPESVAIPA